VIKSFRPFALKRNKRNGSGSIATFFMFFFHNLTVARRNMWKHKTTTAINVFGLAIGLTAFLVIYRIVSYELSFNKHIPDADRIYRVYTKHETGFVKSMNGVSSGVPVYIEEHFSNLEGLTHFFTYGSPVYVEKNGERVSHGYAMNAIIVDKSYFELIDQYEWLAGTPEQSLKNPNSLVITYKKALAYFGTGNSSEIIGKSLFYSSDSLEVHITGVVRQTVETTDFQFTEFISYSSLKGSKLGEGHKRNSWNGTSTNSQTFFKLMPRADPTKLDSDIALMTEFVNVGNLSYRAQPLNDLHYSTDLGIFNASGGTTHLPTLKILGMVAFFLLLLALFNFINLETAQAITRAKEAGIRKTLGSTRGLLTGRFLSESMLTSFLAVIIAIPIGHGAMLFYAKFIPEGIQFELLSINFWFLVIAAGFTVGMIAGLYPAIVFSGYSPLVTLKFIVLPNHRTIPSGL
jgi:hypothetical protein